jgi:hypothetical protein
MKTSCPACACVFGLDAGVSDADGRRFAELVAGLDPRVAKVLIQYLALFRPAKTGLRWSRALALAQELEPMIRQARVSRKGTTYAVPLELWAGALSMLADRPKNLTLPLKTHGYLLEILANQAEKIAVKNETQTEQQKRRPAHDFIKQGDAALKNIEHHLGELKIAAGKKP